MFNEDLRAFLNTDEMADEGLLNGATVRGIFTNGYAEASGGIGMAGTSPTFLLPSDDVPSSPEGMPFSVKGISFVVALPEPDGTGMTTLYLERAS